MFYDLNVPWSAQDRELPATIAFLAELGYNVVALSHTISGKLPADLTCPIPSPLPFNVPKSLTILRRATLVLSDTSQNHRLPALSAAYDLLAVRPTDEKTLKLACESLADADIISLDLAQRLGYHFRFKMLGQAVERGARLEVCYAPAVLAGDSAARRNLIANATQLVRATRGRGLLLSSEARRALAARAPADVVNLAAVWGLGQERGRDAIAADARRLVAYARLKRSSFRGVVDVVYGGERPPPGRGPESGVKGGGEGAGQGGKKRKAVGGAGEGAADGGEERGKALSKREMKRREKKARLQLMQSADAVGEGK